MKAHKQYIKEQKIYRKRKKARFQKLKSKKSVANFKNGDSLRFGSKVINFLLDQSISLKPEKKIKAPRVMCFKKNFVECVNFLFKVVISHYKVEGNICIDFNDCYEVSVSFLITLKIILEELETFSMRVAENRFNQTQKRIKLKPSQTAKVNRHLHSLGFAKFEVGEEEQKEYLSLGLKRGKSRNYRENKKAIVSNQIVQYLEMTAARFGFGFDERGQNYIENMVGEILANAEDHSLEKSEWFVDGVSFLHEEKNNEVIEFNLTIANFGKSMYDGFELTKDDNRDNYVKLERQFEKHKALFSFGKKFERESLFVLYMLNEGISRIKYIESSRGNGTMNFIKSFIDLGRFGNQNKKYQPELNIISGHTVLTCTDEYAPFERGTHYKLTLNKSQTLEELPDADVLKFFKEAYFPGTILDCKIFLNKKDLESKLTAI